jgi:hypothetical protein
VADAEAARRVQTDAAAASAERRRGIVRRTSAYAAGDQAAGDQAVLVTVATDQTDVQGSTQRGFGGMRRGFLVAQAQAESADQADVQGSTQRGFGGMRRGFLVAQAQAESCQDAVVRILDSARTCGAVAPSPFSRVRCAKARGAREREAGAYAESRRASQTVVQVCSICDEDMVHAFKSIVDMNVEQFTQNVCDHSFCVECMVKWVQASLDSSARFFCAHENCDCLMMAADVKRLDAEAGTSLHNRMNEMMHAEHSTMHKAIAEDSAVQKWVEENCAKCSNCGLYIEHGGRCNQMVCHCGEKFKFSEQRLNNDGYDNDGFDSDDFEVVD